MKMNLIQFLESELLPNHWIREHQIDVYVRKSKRYINSQMFPFLDIGTVTVDAKHRHRGIFTAFLDRFENEARKLKRGVYIESILNPRLYQFLLKIGYIPVPGIDPISPSVYKIFS